MGKAFAALLLVVLIVAAIWGVVVLGKFILDYLGRRSKVSRQELDDTEARLYAAEHTLRQIASGNVALPQTEAQLYFDENYNYRKALR